MNAINLLVGVCAAARACGWLVLALAFLAGCAKPPEPEPVPAPTEKETSHISRATNGNVLITLDAEAREAAGLRVASLESASLPPEAPAQGRVLDASTLGTLAADVASARATADASRKEFDRLRDLAASDNTSPRALQAAEAAASRDRALADAARLRLAASWGSALPSREDFPKLVDTLASQESALVELDLPMGENLKALPTSARLAALGGGEPPVDATFVSPAPAVDPQSLGSSFIFLVASNHGRLTPGTRLTGWLKLPGEPETGALLPADSVVRANGAAWAYRQTGSNAFERVQVVLDRPLTNGWLTRGLLQPGDNVVTTGAQQLLSEELKGAAAE